MKNRSKIGIYVALMLVFSLIFIAWGAARTVKAIQFSTECEQYIKRAADASSIDIAKNELSKAISYCEENGLTEGFVSIFLHQPKNDLSFWYGNLKSAYYELDSLPEDATPLEKTNMLMKIRETLTDDDGEGIKVTHPDGISIYPNNVVYCLWGTISSILCLVYFIKVGNESF